MQQARPWRRGCRGPDFLRPRGVLAAGIARERIVLDPGFGFGKTVEHNLELCCAPAGCDGEWPADAGGPVA